MTTTRRAAVTAIATLSLSIPAGTLAGSAEAVTPHAFKNCTAMHKVFPHGVGKPHAHDHTSGTPVTSFKRSLAWYNKNTKSDADKDGIACESA